MRKTSQQMKVLRGTYRADRHGKRKEEKPADPTTPIPEPPEDFNQDQKDLWRDIYEFLSASNLIQPIFRHWIQIFCDQYNLYKLAFKDVQKSGQILNYRTRTGEQQKKNPSVEIMNGASRSMIQISDQFGFTPLAQSRIKGIDFNDGPGDAFTKWNSGEDKWDF